MATSAYKQIIDEVYTQVVALSLTGVTSTNIKVLKLATIRKKEVADLPAVLISPVSQPRVISGTPADNIGKNVIQYPVGVLCIQDGNQDQTTNYDRMALWMEQIFQRFYHKDMSAVTAGNVYTCEVEQRDIFQQSAWFDNLDIGGLILRFNTQLARS